MSVRRSSRLLSKGTGAPLPANRLIQFSGLSPTPTCFDASQMLAIQRLAFHCRWREKDYGDGSVEDWYFSVTAHTNIQKELTFSFWRNYVYVSKNRISFGYYGTHSMFIENVDNAAILHYPVYYRPAQTYTLAANFDDVVKIFTSHLTAMDVTVEDSQVYRFAMPTNDYDICKTEVSFL